MNSNNFLDLKQMREYCDKNVIKFQRKTQINETLVRRLGLEVELEGHSGCVNCLEWNQRGRLLASGSDDTQIIVWDPFRHKKVQCLQSGHQGNIFSVKFIPESNDLTIASGAGDCKVRVHDLTSSETTLSCCCHNGRVKRLAVSQNSPFMFWSSAEDGLVLQYDLRERHRCSTITNNVLINLTNYTGPNAEVKCIAINPIRPEMIAVGASDAFVRVYDRRMISMQNIQNRPDLGTRSSWSRSSRTDSDEKVTDSSNSYPELPVGCVKYFIAGHLLRRLDKRRYRAYASTYLAFSPDGSELLCNLGSEQIYLYDVLRPSKPKLYEMDFSHKNGFHSSATMNGCLNSGTTYVSKNAILYKKSFPFNTPLPSFVDKIKVMANERFERKCYTLAINLYNKAISLCPRAAVLFGNRAMAYMNRQWEGDLYAALRDCYAALNVDTDYYKAHYRLVRCLYDLEWYSEAFDCFQTFKNKFPEHSDNDSFKKLNRDIQKANQTKSESNSIHSQPSDNSTDNPIDVSIGNSSGVQYYMSNAVNNQEKEWRSQSFDYKSRFCGHCNTTTDIKEANFFGSDGQYIIAGSDDGSFFVWDRQTTNIVRVMKGDDSIVNCLQPNPNTCLLATSGIDQVIRLWTPRPEDGTKNDREIENSEDAAIANQKRMNTDPLEVMLANMGYRVPNMLDSEDEDREQVGLQCRTS